MYKVLFLNKNLCFLTEISDTFFRYLETGNKKEGLFVPGINKHIC